MPWALRKHPGYKRVFCTEIIETFVASLTTELMYARASAVAHERAAPGAVVARVIFKVVFALFFIVGGVNHFAHADFYMPMMPDYLPSHVLLVQLSGVAEVLLGGALLVPRLERLAAWGILALLVAVFPANLHMALHPDRFPTIAPAMLWLRLPLQLPLLAWAWVYRRNNGASATS